MTRSKGGVNLDDTTNCPVADVCQKCERPGPTLHAETAHTTLGVECLTLCDDCYGTGSITHASIVQVVNAVAAHCDHLGITLDEMATLLNAEQATESETEGWPSPPPTRTTVECDRRPA